MPAVVLVIAGIDPSGGAGLVADVATVAARGLRVAAVATALTVQDTSGCAEVAAVDAPLVGRQLARLLADVEVAAVKIGMVANARVADEVARALERTAARVVLDPVLRATAGAQLLDEPDAARALRSLLARATLVTPNRDEAARLSGVAVDDAAGQRAAAAALLASGARAVLVKGGHLDGDPVTDLLVDGDGEREYVAARVAGAAPHGTGCALSTEIACALALGAPLRDAIAAARARLQERIAGAAPVGRGRLLLGIA